MNLKTARVLITTKCNKSCSYCCNEQEGALDSMEVVYNLDFMRDFEAIAITGGEPMLYPERVKQVCEKVKIINPNAKIYLYSAQFTPKMWEIVTLVDGIHYSLHEGAGEKEIIDFNSFQTLVAFNKEKSFRLYINNRCNPPITIFPNAWKRVEVKPFMENCPLPENEKLFSLVFQEKVRVG